MVESKADATDCPTMTLPKSIGLERDRTNDGYKLIKNTPVKGAPVIELLAPIQENEAPTPGNVVLQRFKGTKKWAGQGHAETTHRHEKSIPESWQEYFLLFPGTQWRNASNDHMVPCLYYNGSNWEFTFTCLGRKFDETDRLVCF